MFSSWPWEIFALARYLTICWPGTLVSYTYKTDHHNIAEILLKVALNTINQTNPHFEVVA
jgi:hypothetical protein